MLSSLRVFGPVRLLSSAGGEIKATRRLGWRRDPRTWAREVTGPWPGSREGAPVPSLFWAAGLSFSRAELCRRVHIILEASH